jgi:SAM-dependent methyltransferase
MSTKQIDRLLKERSGIKLDIGCGANKHAPDWVGLDMQPLPGVDVVHDLLDFPWPLPDECVSVAICSHVLEHIPKTAVILQDGKLTTIHPFIMVMNEIWRVMQPDGSLAIAVPHGASPGFMRDPTHASQFMEESFYHFDPLAGGGLLWGFYKGFIKPWKIKTDPKGEPYIYFDPASNMEVVLIKRRMDVSYE